MPFLQNSRFRPSKSRLLLYIVLLLFFTYHIFSSYREEHPAHLQQNETRLHLELQNLQPPEGAIEVGIYRHYLAGQVSVSCHYHTNSPYRDIRAHYLAQALTKGWTFTKEDFSRSSIGEPVTGELHFQKMPYHLYVVYQNSSSLAENLILSVHRED